MQEGTRGAGRDAQSRERPELHGPMFTTAQSVTLCQFPACDFARL